MNFWIPVLQVVLGLGGLVLLFFLLALLYTHLKKGEDQSARLTENGSGGSLPPPPAPPTPAPVPAGSPTVTSALVTRPSDGATDTDPFWPAVTWFYSIA